MKRILSTLTLLLCFAITAVNAQGAYDQATMGEKVYLETANWGQNSPFNKQIFTSYGGSTNAKAGCVPTAYAIVMRYHEFPTEGTSKTLYNCQASTYVEITDRVYDFSKMPLTNGSGWTEEQQTEVAKFFSHVLHACFPSSIGTGATTVNEGQTSKVLNDYFNYQLINASYQANFTMEQWAEKLRESIDKGCPVPYAANNSGTGDTRHMFVVDGYTTNGYFHFNFGWSGSGNGWFKLDNITPSQGDNYSWNGNSQHYALFNLAPNKTPRTVTATANPSSMGTVSINGGTAGNSVSAEVTEGTKATLAAHPVDGYALANWTKNGVIVGTKNPIQVTVGESGNEYVANFDDAANVQVEKTCTFKISDVTTSGVNGSYCSTWTTSDGIVLNCTKGSEPAYALSTTVNTFFAKAPVGNSETLVSDITYTLTAPAGYIIKSYGFKGKSPSSSYTIDVTVGGNTTNVTNASAGVVISASDINAKSTSFELGSTYTGRAGLSIMEDGVTVTIVSEGGASTPTPTTYTVTTTANPTNGGTAKFAVGTGSQKTQGDVENGAQITLYAVANNGYNFVNWTLGGNVVSTDATCNVNVAQASNYVANFEAEAQEPEQNVTGTIVGVNRIPTERFDLSQGLQTGYYLLKQVNNNNSAAGGQGVGWIKAANETVGASATSKNTGTPSATDNTYIWYVEVVNAENNLITISTANKVAAWQAPWQREKTLVAYANKATLKYHTGTVNLSGNATPNAGSCFISNEETTAFVHFSGDNLGSWNDTNQNSMFMVEFYKLSIDDLVQKNIVTFEGATYTKTDGTELTSGWGYQVVTQTTPAVTIKVAESKNNFGYTTGVISGVKTPYLYKSTNFILSVPEPYKITGYKMTVKGQDGNYSGDVTCTVDGTETSKATLSGTTTQTLSATELETNTINIGVGGTAGNGIFITALEITYIENEFTPLPFKAEIENWRNDNPNTHLGTITIGGTPLKLTPGHLNASELTMPVVEGTTLAFTRKYRGFEFNGFYIGTTSLGTNPTLTADNVAAINETTPLVAKFTATDDVTLFYDDDQYSYRIPAIAKTGNGMLVAVTDYRHNLDDIGRDNHGTGTKRIDLVMRTSTDNGATWSETKTIAAGDNSKEGSYLRAFGDAAIAAVGQNIVVMAAAGDVVYTAGTTSSPNKMARIYSSDNGATWAIEEMTTKMYSQSTSLIPSGGSAFFGSGKLAVDPNFNGTGNARIYGALLVRIGTDGYNNFGVFSDDLGATWKILGGDNANPVAKGDEPKVEILPNGQILLSARRGGGRVFRVFTYGDDKANGAGSWGDAAVNGCYNGGNNATNGEIICLDAKKPNGKPTKILLQSQPKGGNGQYDRYNVTIWYKEVSADETYTPSSIASGWTQGLEVCPAGVKSAYSAMCLQENGEIAFFFEEAPCYGDDHTKGYSMVYVPLTIEEITNNNFLNPNADVEYVPVEFNIELTDAEGNIYRETLDYVPEDVADALTAKYPFITLGANGVVTDNKYTNTVTLPFKVSNAETTAWYNIYWPANTAENDYPIYLSASAVNDTYVPKVTESKAYGESTYNTLQNGDKISWAIYSVDNTLTFKFKNKLTGKYIQATSVATGNAQNVVYANENNATAFELLPDSYSYAGDYALVAKVDETTGYLCSTSATGYHYATLYNGGNTNRHEGAWLKFVEAPDYQAIVDALIADINNFGEGEGKYVADDAISNIDKDALATMPINSLNTQKEAVQTVKDSYSEITLTIPVANSGSVKIKNEAVSNKFVQKGEVTIEAVPAAGYYFVNWTKPAAQATAAARNVEARNAVEVVSTDNPYTFNLTDAVSLEANFEQVVVTATLTDGQGNQYIVKLDGFTNGITKETVAVKLVEKYPYITLGTAATGITLEGGDAAYTYTNTVTLPLKVSNANKTVWHNIYYPANSNDNPNYIAALNEDEVVDMAASPDHAYGANTTYNTKNGNSKISWAIYNVNDSFEFIFKNEFTGKYIKVESVSSSTTENVKFVENAEDATVFTLLAKETVDLTGVTPAVTGDCDFALVANVKDATGYLCATSSSKSFLTHFEHYNHRGAWVKIVETPDYYSKIMDLGIVLGMKFGAGDGKCVIAGTEIEAINTAMQNSGTITLNNLTAYAATMENAMNNNNAWHDVALTVAPEETGTAIIQLANDDPALTHKRVPTKYNLTINATPAEGYSFVNWTNGTDVVSTEVEYTFKVTAATTLTANFAKNSYTISVATNGTGGSAMIGTETSATVEHGSEVTLTATPSTGYSFAGWYDGENLISAEASYTFTATADGEYVANFELANTPVTHYNVAITSNIENKGVYIFTGDGSQNHLTYDVEVGYSVRLIAVNNNSSVGSTGYVFVGWYNGETLVSSLKDYTFTPEANIALQAKFVEGCNVYGKSNSNQRGTVNIFAADADIDIDDPASDYNNAGLLGISSAMVEKGGAVKLMARANWGCRFVKWTGGSTDNPLVVENIQNDVTYTAEFEPAYYTLTVSSNPATAGTVSATSGTSTGTTVNVGHNMEATITAAANSGYEFVNWTLNGVEVGTDETLTIAGIENVEDMIDVEYVANFNKIDAGEPTQPAGTYYRIGYDGFAAAAAAPAARAAATRAATTQTYVVSPTTGTVALDSDSKTSRWSFIPNGELLAELTLEATANVQTATTPQVVIETKTVKAIKIDGNYLDLYTGGWTDDNKHEPNEVTFTLSVQNSGYKIIGYDIECKGNSAIKFVPTGASLNSNNYQVFGESFTPVTEHSFSFERDIISQIMVKSFKVYIQPVDGEGEGGGETPETPDTPETPSNRYYIQSKASGLSGKANALLMTQEIGASSIFYYADSKLMSYDKGTYLNEVKDMDGKAGARGLQGVDVEGGDVEFSGSKIKVVNGTISTVYLHANQSGTKYFVDRCGTDNCGTPHNFILENVTSLPVTITDAGYASWYAPVAVKLPAEVNAYYLKQEGVHSDYVSMEEIGYGGIVPANTGVILGGDPGEYSLTITTTDVEIEGNLLSGTVAATYVEGDAYVLSNGNNGLGLYLAKKNNNDEWKNNSHKAYLPKGNLPSAAQHISGFRFRFNAGATTAVEKVESRNENEGIYDLTGRKLEGISGTGIYIVNGKKVLVK